MRSREERVAALVRAQARRKDGGRQRGDTALAGFQRSDGVYIAAPRTSRAEAEAALARLAAMDKAGAFGE